ncbi:MAG: YrbL family protein [Halieaceae bacterium]|jgi:hypothetical protein|nr:YrbL family protein [Halieaceae bacterium]
MLRLRHTRPIFVGGTRYCFQHPQHHGRCVKVLRPDRTGAARKVLRRDFKRYLPARFLDDQLKEIKAYKALAPVASEAVWRHVPRYFGIEETDMGVGVVTELLRNEDGSWPRNLEQMLPEGMNRELEAGIREFEDAVQRLRILSRNLLPHNIIAVREADAYRVMLVDGIGNSELVPLSSHIGFFADRKTARKVRRFRASCARLLPD